MNILRRFRKPWYADHLATTHIINEDISRSFNRAARRLGLPRADWLLLWPGGNNLPWLDGTLKAKGGAAVRGIAAWQMFLGPETAHVWVEHWPAPGKTMLRLSVPYGYQAEDDERPLECELDMDLELMADVTGADLGPYAGRTLEQEKERTAPAYARFDAIRAANEAYYAGRQTSE